MEGLLGKKGNSNSDLCKQWLPIERCDWCVLKTPCSYQEMIEKVKKEYEKEIEQVMKNEE